MGSHTLEYHTLQKLINYMKDRRIDKYQYNVGACIVDKRGQVLSYGSNSYMKTHPIMLSNTYYKIQQKFIHAEADAITKCKVLNPYMMVVCRIDRHNRLRIARPCIGCYSLIKEYNIKKVFFTNNDEELSLLNLNINIDDYYGDV